MNYYLIFYFMLLVFLEVKMPKFKNIQLTSLVHSTIVGCSTNYLLITDYDRFTNIFKYDLEETNYLYYYIPYYSLLYSFIDINESFKMQSNIFIFHGIMMLFSISISIYFGKNHYLTTALILEVSTIFYNFLSFNNIILNLLFGLTFLFYRNVVFFSICVNYLIHYYENRLYLKFIHNFIVFSLVSFNCLNFYWGKKLVRKMLKINKNL